MRFVFLLFVLCQAILSANGDLELVKDEELVNLIRSEKYVVALFSSKQCEKCQEFENELVGLREDLVESLNAWVVKLHDSSMTRLYTPNKEPALVFFRHGIPLLYDGPLNDEYILHVFSNNKEPAVKELTDETFEHLTQAATGATTGDWFVMFYTNDCVDCQRLQARWEAVGAQLKSRMNVARVNRATTGAKTARRFNVFEVPTFILFRRGKMYKYHNAEFDVTSFVSFAQDWYKNVKPESVPVPKAPFDDLVAMVAGYFKENPWMFQVGFGTFLVGLILSVLAKFLKKSPEDKSKKQEKKGKKETSKEK